MITVVPTGTLLLESLDFHSDAVTLIVTVPLAAISTRERGRDSVAGESRGDELSDAGTSYRALSGETAGAESNASDLLVSPRGARLPPWREAVSPPRSASRS